ncbi:MAG: MBL fold metallo-hydrolase [Planctomycetaceae bacterium]|nr:MBL fold metallo-hydrolase [Planctomycetaceae bacterium]
MLERRELFPHVIEMNYQARRRFGCSVYLVYDGPEWLLMDIGYEDTVDEIVELIRMMDFPLAGCKYLVASHADVDHIQGFHRALQLLPEAKIVGHADAARLLLNQDRLMTYAEIPAQNISIDLPAIKVDQIIKEGDHLQVGDQKLEVWHTPGHTHGQLSFRMGDLLFSGDNLFRDGCVGNIDAHHGSNIPDFIRSLKRIRDSDVKWLLPSHGPVFPRDPAMIQRTIDRLETYQHMADFGTCAVDWPLLDEWENELMTGIHPCDARTE